MATPKPSGSQRKPGKQPGSKGAGRQLEMRVTDVVEHKAAECSGCGACFAEESPFVATTGKYVLDIETGWQENAPRGFPLVWLWVLRTATATLYLIGRRSWDTIADIMEQFSGWLMSDGYGQYRHYHKRLRCLAHLIRKARGLEESCHPAAAHFGEKVLATLTLFITGVYAARGDPDADLLTKFARNLDEFKEICEQHRHQAHDKTQQLAREFLHDWEAIWAVLAHPELPLTNNAAERALRHWVISRKISSGTRTPRGSRAFALLASVIDTCRQRGVSPWPYLADVIAARRRGDAPPPLPLPISA